MRNDAPTREHAALPNFRADRLGGVLKWHKVCQPMRMHAVQHDRLSSTAGLSSRLRLGAVTIVAQEKRPNYGKATSLGCCNIEWSPASLCVRSIAPREETLATRNGGEARHRVSPLMLPTTSQASAVRRATGESTNSRYASALAAPSRAIAKPSSSAAWGHGEPSVCYGNIRVSANRWR